MAIQVSGTTVIDDSRNLVSVIGLKTVGGTAILGSGDIAVGASTTFGAVGTYTWGRPANATDFAFGDTSSGIYPVGVKNSSVPNYDAGNGNNLPTSFLNSYYGTAQSGTWRCMSMGYGTGLPTGNGFMGLWVRIS
jgi:hypothetical protein